jgi:hypothetical protein
MKRSKGMAFHKNNSKNEQLNGFKCTNVSCVERNAVGVQQDLRFRLVGYTGKYFDFEFTK